VTVRDNDDLAFMREVVGRGIGDGKPRARLDLV
jgi:hypothetical protein